MKAFWNYFIQHYRMGFIGTLVVMGVSLLFIFLVDVDNVVEPKGSEEYGYTLFGLKAFHLFSLLMMIAWMVILYRSRAKTK